MQLLREGKSFSGREKNCVFINLGDEQNWGDSQNLGGKQFANASGVSGLDFPDDGRAIAATDWDHDGDLDLWISNRTGPRLRFLRNQAVDAPARTLAIRLRGVTCNRDAIGARVELRFAKEGAPVLTRTLHAGDGYLAQSTKWLHFGLGQLGEIQQVSVRWPDGEREAFTEFQPGGRYLLVQGSGQALPVARPERPVELTPQPQESIAADGATRVALASRPPLPLIEYQTWDGAAQKLQVGSRPRLLVFWSRSCPACIQELALLRREADQLAGLDLLALSIDAIDPTESAADIDAARQLVDRLELPFESGLASPATAEKLNLLLRIILNHQGSFSIPLSLLVDAEGQVSVLYRGAVGLEQIVEDWRHLASDAEARRRRAVPFAGRWTTPPKQLLLRPIAKVFREHGYEEDYQRFLQLEVSRLAAKQHESTDPGERHATEMSFAAQCFDLASSLHAGEQFEEAVEYYRQGLAVISTQANARTRLGEALMRLGRTDESVEEFQRAAHDDPQAITARIELARIWRQQGDMARAERAVNEALTVSPAHVEALFVSGLLSVDRDDLESAVDAFQTVVTSHPDHVESWLNLAAVQARQRRFAAAAAAYRAAWEHAPQSEQAAVGLANVLAASNEIPAALSACRAIPGTLRRRHRCVAQRAHRA